MNYPQEKIKPYNADEKKSVQVEKMFDNIAPAYDQLNHALSWNIDKSWRRKAINWLEPFHPQHIMDVATGSLSDTSPPRADRYRYIRRHDECGT